MTEQLAREILVIVGLTGIACFIGIGIWEAIYLIRGKDRGNHIRWC